MDNNKRLVIDDVNFDTLPAGTASVKVVAVLPVTIFFVGIWAGQ